MAEHHVICQYTSKRAENGECPVHRGDACLIVLPAFVEHRNAEVARYRSALQRIASAESGVWGRIAHEALTEGER